MAGKAASSDPYAEEAATRALADGGNAVDAVVAGFLAASAARASVLLSPLAAMVAGVGVGARCFDGRGCQPGRGIARPRGLLPDDDVPEAARAAVPRSIGALLLLHAYGADLPLSALATPAVALAKKHGSVSRGELLSTLAKRGAAVLKSVDIRRALVAAAGPSAGGLMSDEDLDTALPGDTKANFSERGDTSVAIFDDSPFEGRPACPIVAADGRGVVAALSFAPDDDGVRVAWLDLVLPRDAEPVRRGVPRVTPGLPRRAALPIAILRHATERWLAAVGARTNANVDGSTLGGSALLGDQLRALQLAAGDDGELIAASIQRRETAVTRIAGGRAPT